MSGQFDPRITAYFGDAVLQAGFMPLPHLFLRHYRSLGLSQVQAMFVLQLMEIVWDVGDPPNSVGKLAARMGLSQRSIRACSKEVHDLGLVHIYDQWDEGGAQVENSYDLGPLFRKLAALVPAHQPTGQQRIRRQRTNGLSASQQEAASPPLHESSPTPLQEIASPPVQNHSGEGVRDHTPLPGTNDHGGSAQTITGPLQKGSGLKTESKKHQKTARKKQQHHVGGVLFPLSANGDMIQGGHSLRSDVTISGEEVQHSRTILDWVGLHTLVVEQAAPTLTPAEAWSLVCYARGASLGPAWIAKQIFDWTQRTAQASQLSPRYDEVGRLLAALAPEQSQRLVEVTDECCPQAAERWRTACAEQRANLASAEAMQHEHASNAVWSVMAEQRRSVAAPSVEPPSQPPAPPAPSEYTAQWSAVLDALREDMPYADWRSWIAPLEFLELDGDNAVIGAPNVFVRNEACATYGTRIANALRSAFGRDLKVEVVIGTLVLG
jgi:hypothetical protein